MGVLEVLYHEDSCVNVAFRYFSPVQHKAVRLLRPFFSDGVLVRLSCARCPRKQNPSLKSVFLTVKYSVIA